MGAIQDYEPVTYRLTVSLPQKYQSVDVLRPKKPVLIYLCSIGQVRKVLYCPHEIGGTTETYLESDAYLPDLGQVYLNIGL